MNDKQQNILKKSLIQNVCSIFNKSKNLAKDSIIALAALTFFYIFYFYLYLRLPIASDDISYFNAAAVSGVSYTYTNAHRIFFMLWIEVWQSIFGITYYAYYASTFSAGLLLIWSAFFCGRLFLPTIYSITGSILMLSLPVVVNHVPILLPEILCTALLFTAIYFFIKSFEAKGYIAVLLCTFSGFFFTASYTTKETIFITFITLPIYTLFSFRNKHGIKCLGITTFSMIFFFCLECIFNSIVHNDALWKFNLILGSHVSNGAVNTWISKKIFDLNMTWFDLLFRFVKIDIKTLPAYGTLFYLFTAISTLFLLGWKALKINAKDNELNKFHKQLKIAAFWSLMSISLFLFISIAFSRTVPMIIPLLRTKVRYLLPFYCMSVFLWLWPIANIKNFKISELKNFHKIINSIFFILLCCFVFWGFYIKETAPNAKHVLVRKQNNYAYKIRNFFIQATNNFQNEFQKKIICPEFRIRRIVKLFVPEISQYIMDKNIQDWQDGDILICAQQKNILSKEFYSFYAGSSKRFHDITFNIYGLYNQSKPITTIPIESSLFDIDLNSLSNSNGSNLYFSILIKCPNYKFRYAQIRLYDKKEDLIFSTIEKPIKLKKEKYRLNFLLDTPKLLEAKSLVITWKGWKNAKKVEIISMRVGSKPEDIAEAIPIYMEQFLKKEKT